SEEGRGGEEGRSRGLPCHLKKKNRRLWPAATGSSGADRRPRPSSARSSATGVMPCFFFFQAEDGIRDWSVTGVQTCALPISEERRAVPFEALGELGGGMAI